MSPTPTPRKRPRPWPPSRPPAGPRWRNCGGCWGGWALVPGLADLDILLAEVGKAGLAVKLQINGTRPPLPAGVDLSAYRIVQEALTNRGKDAGPAHAQVVDGDRHQGG